MLKESRGILILTVVLYVLLGVSFAHRDELPFPDETLFPEPVKPIDPHDQVVGDPARYGMQLALSDIAKGEVRYYMYGLRYDNPQTELQHAFPEILFTTVLRGCEIGGREYDRDKAYNFTVDAWLKNRYGQSVEDVIAENLPKMRQY